MSGYYRKDNTCAEPERQVFALGQAVGLGFVQPLSLMQPGSVGRILTVSSGSSSDRNIERGLLKMGFVEGVCVEIVLRQGAPSPLKSRLSPDGAGLRESGNICRRLAKRLRRWGLVGRRWQDR